MVSVALVRRTCSAACALGAAVNRDEDRGCAVVLPNDAVIAREFRAGTAHAVVPTLAVPADAMILDVGPKSVAHMKDVLKECKTLLWNGPLGAFETTVRVRVERAQHTPAHVSSVSIGLTPVQRGVGVLIECDHLPPTVERTNEAAWQGAIGL